MVKDPLRCFSRFTSSHDAERTVSLRQTFITTCSVSLSPVELLYRDGAATVRNVPSGSTWWLHNMDTNEGDFAGEDSEEEEQEEDTGTELLALYLGDHNRLGCAHYKQRECRVEVFETSCFVNRELNAGAVGTRRGSGGATGCAPLLSLEDVPPSLTWLVQFLSVRRPALILPDRGANLLRDIVRLLEGCCTSMRLDARSAFDADAAMPRLHAMYPNVSVGEWATRLNLRHRAMLAAMAALLSFTATVQSNIADVVEVPPVQVLHVEEATARDLQLLRTEQHPCDYQGVGRAKEGLSLFTVVNHTQCTAGRELLRQWFALPSSDLQQIERRQRVVAYFVDPAHRDMLRVLRTALHKIRPSGRIFTRMRGGKMTLKQYQTLARTIRGILTVYEVVLPVAHALQLLRELVESVVVEQLQVMLRLMERTVYGVIGEGRRRGEALGENVVVGGAGAGPSRRRTPKRTGRGGSWAVGEDIPGASAAAADCEEAGGAICVNPGVDPHGTLDELRGQFSHLSLALRRKAEDAFDRLSPALRRFLFVRCVFVTPHGYLLCVGKDYLARSDVAALTRFEAAAAVDEETEVVPLMESMALLQDGLAATASPVSTDEALTQTLSYLRERYGWELHHEADGWCYFKTDAMTELDRDVGDLRQRIEAREDALRGELDTALLYRSLHLLTPTRYIAELDCLLSFADCAIQYSWNRPVLRPPQEGILCVEDGWHPVLGRAIGASQLRPFSLYVTQPHERVAVVLGANGSGKSVLLGAVAQIVFLAQLGSFVPAAKAGLSVLSSLFSVSSVQVDEPVYDSRGSAVTAVTSTATSSFHAECTSLSRILRFVDTARRTAFSAVTTTTEAAEDSSVALDAAQRCVGTLVLMDEFGRGTAPEDGSALLSATLRYMAGTLPFHDAESSDVAEMTSQRTAMYHTMRPLVLCATHYVELLDSARRLSARSREASVAFPFDSVVVYDMRCTPVRTRALDGHDGTDSARRGAGGEHDEADFKNWEAAPAYTTDLVPTFVPVRITRHVGHHEEEYNAYRAQLQHSGPALGRQCGLHEGLQRLWEATVQMLEIGAEASGSPSCSFT